MAQAKTKRPETKEIASIQRDVTRLMFGGVLQNTDDTLITRGQGKGLKIYDEIERDAHAFADLQKRKLAVTSRPWMVESASDSAMDKDAADLVSRQLSGLGKSVDEGRQLVTGFDQTTANFLDATLKGFAVGEVMWEVDGAELVARRIIARDQRRFQFDEESRLRLISRENMMPGELLPPRKFIVHRFGAKDDSPYGLGLGTRLFWPVFFKRKDITFWLTFADKFGSPTAIGKYPGGTGKPEQDKLLAALQAIAQEAGIIIPEGMVVELLEASRAGSIDTYEKLARYMDEQISECILGGSITTTPKATGLGSGVADTQNDVRLELAKADADLLSDTLNATLVRWIVDYNLPGAAYPTLWRDFEKEKGGDINTFTIGLSRLVSMGMKVPLDYVHERFNIPQATADQDVLTAPVGGAPGEPGMEFAERAHPAPAVAAIEAATVDQETIDRAADELAADWEKLLGKKVDELVAFAESSGDLVTFRKNLGELLKGAPSAALAGALERSAVVARLLGGSEER